jgi:dihydroflavonol-4-reductase
MELKGKTIAVTGASGMLGPYLCRALAAQGAKVRGVVRNPKKAKFLEREGVELAYADLMNGEALTDAFRGCDALVSNAALYRLLNVRWKDNYRANAEGTENVYEAAAAAGVGRVVHISTFGVYRWHLGKPVFNDDSPTLDGARKQGGAYRATKQMSEALAFQLSKKHGMATTAVRPAGIFGARDHNTVPYFRAFFNLPVAFAPTFSFPFVYAGDIARAVTGALRNDASVGKAYITAGQNGTVYEFAKAWRQARGAKNLVIPIPTGLGMYVDCSRAEREIDFVQRSFVENLREMFEADARYRAEGVPA